MRTLRVKIHALTQPKSNLREVRISLSIFFTLVKMSQKCHGSVRKFPTNEPFLGVEILSKWPDSWVDMRTRRTGEHLPPRVPLCWRTVWTTMSGLAV